MSERVYADEATLTAHLDKLLSTATPTHTPSLYTDTTIAPNQLLTGHILSNEQLSKLGITQLPPLPTPDVTKPVDDILAAAFTAIIRLSQCAQANKNLRESAEASLRNATTRIDDLSKRLCLTEEKVKKKDGQITTMRNTLDETGSKHRVQLRKLSTECNQLRTRLLHASHRENQLLLSAKKKEKEFGQLQSRVHALFKSSVNIEQRITRVGTRVSPRADESLDADLRDVGQERVDAIEGENDVMRGLLQAVQEELDDLIVTHGETGSEVSQEFDVPPAPGDDVMKLPLEVIQDDLQDCLERKFGILRRALGRGGRASEYVDRDAADGEELADSQPVGRGEDDVSADSAHRSVDVVSGKVEGVDHVAQSLEEDTDHVKENSERVDADADQVDTDEAERVDANEEQIDADLEQVAAEGADAQVETNFVPVDAHDLPTNEGTEPLDAETAPVNTVIDTATVAGVGPVDAYAELGAKNADAVEDALKTLSITDASQSRAEHQSTC